MTLSKIQVLHSKEKKKRNGGHPVYTQLKVVVILTWFPSFVESTGYGERWTNIWKSDEHGRRRGTWSCDIQKRNIILAESEKLSLRK